MPPKASDIDFAGRKKPDATEQRIFRVRGENEYSLEVEPAGITFYLSRLRRTSNELWGELTVSLTNGHFPQARTTDSVLLAGDLNISSVNARKTRGKDLAERSSAADLDWHGFVEELAYKVIAAERKGRPSVVLADEPDSEEGGDTWDVDGFPLLRDLPMVMFGRGEAGKSYFSMYVAGTLAQRDISVLYADWEFSKKDHRRRFGKLFQPMPRGLHYVSCDKPMREEVERLTNLIREHKCQYIICDSVAFALEGNAADSEQAGIYFRHVRQLKIGSLHIAHTTKSDDDSEKQIFGSVFFQNGARSIWFIERANENPPGTLQFGLYQRKNSLGERLKPKGFRLVFRQDRTVIEKVNLEDVDDLVAKLPLLDRMKHHLKRGAMSVKFLAEACDSTPGVIRKMVSKYSTVFIRTGDKVGLLQSGGSSDVDF